MHTDPALRKALEAIYPSEEASAIVRWLLAENLQKAEYEAAASRLILGEPLQYVLGYSEFYGRRFSVNPSVLIPRPETEYLCSLVIDEARRLFGDRPLRILDLCCGSGCITWTLAGELRCEKVCGVDISPEALSVASRQFGGGRDFQYGPSASGQSVLPYSERLPEFVLGDILRPLPDIGGGYDIIVSNPPYITMREKSLMHRNVLEHEPSLALFVPDDDPLRFYKAIAALVLPGCGGAPDGLLAGGGFVFMEVNDLYASEVKALFPERAEIIKDISGKDRFVYWRR